MPTKPDTRYADVILKDKRRQILATDQLWEHNTVVNPDIVSPALLAPMLSEASNDLLRHSTEHGVALDWATSRWHIFRSPITGESLAILRVDVLP